ncbi:MAG TPA: FtsX-like permease family protein [Planctomycetes bacterium]|nr:FtsX-like permease family protein [Planctomycetota bacterium]
MSEPQAHSQLYGEELLDRLQHGWAPLPNKTLFTLVMGGLQIRMMRSLVTMVSIVLAIAFLTYTGLANQLFYNLAEESKRLADSAPVDPGLITEAAAALERADVAGKLSLDERRRLAVEMQMHKTVKLEAEMLGLTRPLQRAQADSDKFAGELASVEKDPVSTPQDVARARASIERARAELEALRAKRDVLNEEIAVGRWLRNRRNGGAAMDDKLLDALRVRTDALVSLAATPGRLNEDGLRQLEILLKYLAGRTELAEPVKTMTEALAQEKRKRTGSDITLRLRQAGINIQATLEGNPLDTWLIIMALLTCTVGIANAMLMSVTERFREIGTMKCLGALDALIVKMFLLESGMLGAVGALIGIVFGLIVALVAALLQFGWHGIVNFPLAKGLVVLSISVLAGLLLAIIGAVYPALVAAGMKPVDALRVDE